MVAVVKQCIRAGFMSEWEQADNTPLHISFISNTWQIFVSCISVGFLYSALSDGKKI
jgi:hypothetical protein